MNLRAIANNSTRIINKNVEVVVRKYLSSEQCDNGKRRIQYKDIFATAQIQPVDSFKLQHIDGYSQGGVFKAFYLNGDFTGITAPNGNDLIMVGKETYKIIDQPEGWDLTSGWSKVIGARQ